MHEWITDSGQTSHLVVDATVEGVNVPSQHVRDGKIVLNISPQATQALAITNESVSFSARFGGVPTPVEVPVEAVLGVYSRETGQGMIFTDADGATDGSGPDGDDGDDGGDGPSGRRSHLTVVK